MSGRSWADLVVQTEAAFTDPKVGDRFSEMFSFWVYVVDTGSDSVTVMEGGGHPSRFPGWLRPRVFATRAEFRAAYANPPTIGGYWVKFEDGGNDVSGWLQAADPALELEEK